MVTGHKVGVGLCVVTDRSLYMTTHAGRKRVEYDNTHVWVRGQYDH